MEEWRDIKGYEGLYQISNLGRVKGLKRNKCLKERVTMYGYNELVLSKNGICKSFKVHRLVAQAFIPNPNNYPEINHKDENKLNNCVDNLEWCTRKYNNNYGVHKERLYIKRNEKGRFI